jgi:hypothetical protein
MLVGEDKSTLSYFDGTPTPARPILDDPVPQDLQSMAFMRTVLVVIALVIVLMFVVAFAIFAIGSIVGPNK